MRICGAEAADHGAIEAPCSALAPGMHERSTRSPNLRGLPCLRLAVSVLRLHGFGAGGGRRLEPDAARLALRVSKHVGLSDFVGLALMPSDPENVELGLATSQYVWTNWTID
jgi:hypothetical protein